MNSTLWLELRSAAISFPAPYIMGWSFCGPIGKLWFYSQHYLNLRAEFLGGLAGHIGLQRQERREGGKLPLALGA